MRKQILIEYTADKEHSELIEMILMSNSMKLVADNGGSEVRVQAKGLLEQNAEFDIKIPKFMNTRRY